MSSVGIHKREERKETAFGHVWSRLVKAERHRSGRREQAYPRLGKPGDGASRVGGGAISEAGEFLAAN